MSFRINFRHINFVLKGLKTFQNSSSKENYGKCKGYPKSQILEETPSIFLYTSKKLEESHYGSGSLCPIVSHGIYFGTKQNPQPISFIFWVLEVQKKKNSFAWGTNFKQKKGNF